MDGRPAPAGGLALLLLFAIVSGSGAVRAEAVAEPVTERFENDVVAVTVSSRHGAIVSWRLKDARYREEAAGVRMPIDLADAGGVLELHCYDAADPSYREACPTDYAVLREGPSRIVLDSLPSVTARVRVRQVYEFGGTDGPYAVRRTVTVEPAAPGTPVTNLVLWTGVGVREPREAPSGGFLRPALNLQRGLCLVNGELDARERGDVGAGARSHGVIGYAGVDDTYFLSAVGFRVHQPLGRRDFCLLGIDAAEFRPALRAAIQFVPTDLVGPKTYELAAYFGPKTLDSLREVASLPGLDETIDFGWFGPISLVMLRIMQFFHGIVASWGIAIVLLTLVVRLMLFPLTHWSAVSMRRMAALKPFLDEINAKHPDDKQRRTQAIMDLYRTHKVNPLSGCLPLLIQMPIWIALYRAIASSAELYQASFLYLSDLTKADPYFALPVVLGLAMFAQQKMVPTTMDPMQAKIMLYGMPILFTVFMLFLPSGLNLYILASTVLGIAQQQVTNRLVPMPAFVAAKGGAPQATAQAAPGDAKPAAGGSRDRRRRRR